MALKIYQSQSKVNTGRPSQQTSALFIPMGLATKSAEGVKAIAKAYADYKTYQQDTIDENRTTDLIIEAKKDISKVIVNSKKNTNLDEVEGNLNDVFKSFDLKNESKGVQQKFAKWSNNYKKIAAGQAFKNSSAALALQTTQSQTKKINTWALDAASNDPFVRAEAEGNLQNYFNNPNNAQYFTDFEATKNETYALKEKLKTKFDVKNNPEKYLNKVELHDKFGPQVGDEIYDQASAELTKQNVNAENLLILKEQEGINQSVYNFTDIANRILLSQSDKSNSELLAKVPSIDDVYDYWKSGKINEAQYQSILDIYTNPNKTTKDELINLINNQIVIAETVEQVEDMQNYNATAQEVLKDINLSDLASVNKVIAQVKSDPTKHQEYKDYLKILRTNMNDVGGTFDLISLGSQVQEEKQRAIGAEKIFLKKFSETGNAEQAYLDTIKNFKDAVPTLLSEQLKPLHYNFTDLKAAIKNAEKQGNNAFDTARDTLVIKVKNGELSMSDLKLDLERLDLMEDIFHIRKKLSNGDEDYLFQLPNGSGGSTFKKFNENK